jgi:phage tail sheath protein FI
MPISVYQTPGVYIEEISSGSRPIEAVGTSTAAFVGWAPEIGAYVNEARAINNWTEFLTEFTGKDSVSTPLSHAVHGFFLNGGRRCYVVNVGEAKKVGGGPKRSGLEVLEAIEDISIVAIPGFTDSDSYEAALSHCEGLKDRFAILDAPETVENLDLLKKVAVAEVPVKPPEGETDKPAGGSRGRAGAGAREKGLRPRPSPGGYGAFYFPSIVIRDPLSTSGANVVSPPCGHIAGLYARTDAARGVHKAPANEPLRGALNITYRLTGEEQGTLNQNGVNCIRLFPRDGILVWGARTVADSASEWRYVNVRRLFTMIESSIGRHTRWVVFEPNDPSLWKSIRRDISAFLGLVWRDGALRGDIPEQAFFVKCDEETNPQEVIDAGQVVIMIGIAPVKPAEFVIFKIGQSAGGTETELL